MLPFTEPHLKKIRALRADDHPVVRAGVRAFLESEPDIVVVGEASIGCQAVSLAQDLHPDVVVMDVAMPGNGLDATRPIRATCAATQVIIFTFHNQDTCLLNAVQAGAAGFVPKSAADTELVAAIRTVAEGDAFLSPSSTRLVVQEYRAGLANDRADALDPLSEREHEVLHLLTEEGECCLVFTALLRRRNNQRRRRDAGPLASARSTSTGHPRFAV